MPPHYLHYDRGFIRWLTLHHYEPDFLSDDDFDRLGSAATLARDYRLIVFSGHEEYTTSHEYDLAERYRNRGGHLAFLSANDFFYKVVKHGNTMDGRWRWRDLGRPEAALVGAQYVGWNEDQLPEPAVPHHRRAARPRGSSPARTAQRLELRDYGIEVDSRDAARRRAAPSCWRTSRRSSAQARLPR